MKEIEFVTFFSGEVEIEGKRYNFGEQSIGYRRHYAARSANSKISRVIHIPYTRDISAQSLAVIGDESFIIDLVQPTTATHPHCTVLTLIDYGVSSDDRR